MQDAIDRVMKAYSLMVALSPEDEAKTRQGLVKHLATAKGDENALAIEGLRYLRGRR